MKIDGLLLIIARFLGSCDNYAAMNTQSISLDQIYSPILGDLPKAEERILEILKTPNELSSEVIRYFFKAKGKFLRPALCLLGAGVFGKIADPIIHNAAALEIFHSATLIHDDIIDSAYLRRNIPTINVVWNPQVAVLVGDYLHDKAIGAIFGLNNQHAISKFLETAGLVCDGEILELNEKGNYCLREDQYITIVERKTAVLLACCLETSAILAGASLEEAAVLKRYGIYFGIAFQIIDDYLDFVGKENEFGKTLGADCAAGVLTLPLIRLLQVAREDKRSEIVRFIESGLEGKDLQQVIGYLKQTNALDYTMKKAREYADRARLEISVLKDSPAKQSLNSLLDYILDRNR